MVGSSQGFVLFSRQALLAMHTVERVHGVEGVGLTTGLDGSEREGIPKPASPLGFIHMGKLCWPLAKCLLDAKSIMLHVLPPSVCPWFFTFLFDHRRLSHCWDLTTLHVGHRQG